MWILIELLLPEVHGVCEFRLTGSVVLSEELSCRKLQERDQRVEDTVVFVWVTDCSTATGHL